MSVLPKTRRPPFSLTQASRSCAQRFSSQRTSRFPSSPSHYWFYLHLPGAAPLNLLDSGTWIEIPQGLNYSGFLPTHKPKLWWASPSALPLPHMHHWNAVRPSARTVLQATSFRKLSLMSMQDVTAEQCFFQGSPYMALCCFLLSTYANG